MSKIGKGKDSSLSSKIEYFWIKLKYSIESFFLCYYDRAYIAALLYLKNTMLLDYCPIISRDHTLSHSIPWQFILWRILASLSSGFPKSFWWLFLQIWICSLLPWISEEASMSWLEAKSSVKDVHLIYT